MMEKYHSSCSSSHAVRILKDNSIIVFKNNYVTIEEERIKHQTEKLALDVYRYIIGDLCRSQVK